jgi:serine/threonine-protein kinase
MTHAPDQSWTIPSPGETIAGKYYVESTCGCGGLAVVLSAIQIGLDRRVAVKLLLPHWAHQADVVERFLREGRAATRIRSEHVVRVFDVGRLESGAPFLVLEYLEGNDLDAVLRQWGPLPVATAIDWVLQATEAIAEAHAHGIVHRDLKPANLFLTHRTDGTSCVKVIDFGLSKIADPWSQPDKLTRPTDVMGSPHYMAPEQLRATCEADARADLWALGAVLHELISGRPPFYGATMAELCAAVLTEAPEPLSIGRPGVPAGVEQAVLRCLEKDPAARFASVAEFAQALAPFGSPGARGSCERIERVVGLSPRARDVSSLPPLVYEGYAEADWPGGSEPASIDTPTPALRARGVPASPRIVAGSLLILSALGAASLMAMYASVHANDPRATQRAWQVNEAPGRASMQPSSSPATVNDVPVIAAPVAANAPAAAPPPAAPPAPSPATPPPAREAVPPEAAPAASTVAEAPPTRKHHGPTQGPAPRSRKPGRGRASSAAAATARATPPEEQAPMRAPPGAADDPNASPSDSNASPAEVETTTPAPPAPIPTDDRAFEERQ